MNKYKILKDPTDAIGKTVKNSDCIDDVACFLFEDESSIFIGTSGYDNIDCIPSPSINILRELGVMNDDEYDALVKAEQEKVSKEEDLKEKKLFLKLKKKI